MSAAYISSMTGELAQIALKHGHNFLGYLLQMAAEEASSLFSQPEGGAPHGRTDRQPDADDGSKTEG